MPPYTIHPIAMGTKLFDKNMMKYQYGQGETYTIPILWITASWKIISKMWRKKKADILLPLHEPRFAAMGTIG